MTPQFKHDCKVCVFLGRDLMNDDFIPRHIDTYICVTPHGQEVILRYGNAGDEYMSLDFCTIMEGLKPSSPRYAAYRRAAKLAIAKGLVVAIL